MCYIWVPSTKNAIVIVIYSLLFINVVLYCTKLDKCIKPLRKTFSKLHRSRALVQLDARMRSS